MKKCFLFLLMLLMVSSIMAQKTDAMLFGDVKNYITGEHIPYVRIQVKGTKLMVTSDSTGHFQLPHLPLGKQTIVASSMGYITQEKEVIMVAGQGTEVYFLLREEKNELKQVVVTGTRTPHYLKDVPIRTEVLTNVALEKKNAFNLFGALEGLPGIRVEEQCQFCNFSMVRMQGLGAEHTQVLVDGEPIYSGLAGVYGLSQMGTVDVDRLEIVKGAGSALYGSSAVAGAINVISKEPAYEPEVSTQLQMGNFGFKNYQASASKRYGGIGLSLFAQYTKNDAIDASSDGYTRKEIKKKDGVSDAVASQLTNISFALHFYEPFTKRDKLVLRGKVMEEARKGGEITNNTYLNPFTAGTEDIKTNRLSVDLNYKLPFGKHSELNYATAYVFHKRNATNDTFLGDYQASHNGASPDVESMRPYLADESTFTPSLTFRSELGRHRLLGGVQGSWSWLNESGLYCINDKDDVHYGTAYISKSRKYATEIGFFVQDEWEIIPGLVAVPGLRFDIHRSGEEYDASEKVFDTAFPKTSFSANTFNPRLALKYAINKQFTLRANVGMGYRAPYGFSEDLHLCSGSPRVWKSSSLKGERAVSFNLSADYYGRRVQLSVNLFRKNLRNKIEFAPASADVRKLGYTYQWENVDNAYVQGLELTAKWTPIHDLKMGVSWTFNQGKYNHIRADWANTSYAEASRNVSRFPNMTGDFSIEYSPNKWSFIITSSLQGKMYIDYIKNDEVSEKIKETPLYTLWNLRASRRIGKFNLFAGGKNIFSYLQDEKHTDNAAFMYAPVYGASWYAGISINL